MHAEIIRVSQDIDLKSGSTEYFIVLSLPNGKVVRASIAQEDAQVLLLSSSAIESAAANYAPEGSPLDAPEEPPYEPPPWSRAGAQQPPEKFSAPEGAFVFGGQDVSDAPVEPPPQPPPRQNKPKRRMTTVPKDDMGYPIVRDGAVDPGEVSGASSGEVDEEGIGQG